MTNPGPSEATPSTAGSVREALDLHRDKLASIRECQRQKMNHASDAAERAAAEGDMAEVSINSTESERHREAFSALNVAIDILDDLSDAIEKALSAPVEAPVAWIEREALEFLRRDKKTTATVASGLLKKPFGDKVPLYATARPLPSVDLTSLIEERAQQIHMREHSHFPGDSDKDRAAMYRIRTELDKFATAILTLLGGSAR